MYLLGESSQEGVLQRLSEPTIKVRRLGGQAETNAAIFSRELRSSCRAC